MYDRKLQEVKVDQIRFSQNSISKTYDEDTSVDTWLDILPYTMPIEIVEIDNETYVTLDNRRLYSAKKHSNTEAIKCYIYGNNEDPPDLMANHGMDVLQMVWGDTQKIHQLTIRAKTMEAMVVILCSRQNSLFSLHGQLEPPELGNRQFDGDVRKFSNGRVIFDNSDDDYQDSLRTATEVYVRIQSPINVFHKRPDLRSLVLNRDDLFEVERYECTTDPLSFVTAVGCNSLLDLLSEEEARDRD